MFDNFFAKYFNHNEDNTNATLLWHNNYRPFYNSKYINAKYYFNNKNENPFSKNLLIRLSGLDLQ